MKITAPSFLVFFFLFVSCTNNETHTRVQKGYNEDVLKSVLAGADSLKTHPFVEARVEEIKKALLQAIPVLRCADSLDTNQMLAQEIALTDSAFKTFLFDPFSKQPFRNEIFGVYPARESDLTGIKTAYNLGTTYRVEMYNYALNNTSVAFVDVQQKKTIHRFYLSHMQPDIPGALTKLAIKIAQESKEVQDALGFKPGDKDALMASTKTSLNRSRCERSKHLCVAPTFVKDGKALWAIVDLTDYRIVGVRWTNVGITGKQAPLITEKRLQDDKITSCYCEVEQQLKKNGWEMKYMLTSSDGLRVTDVSYNGKKTVRSAKLVDWHVSYSGTEGFGYSDAVGCPYFSQSAVVAWEIPKVISLTNDENKEIGFVLEQTFRSEGWPTPCNYNYRQRFEFYNDGKFRIAAASIGRGCGNDGTYRPVFRIAFEGEENNFFEHLPTGWSQWQQERWQLQSSATAYTPEGYQYKIEGKQSGYYLTPGNGQFKDGGKGDNSYVYTTKHVAGREEGESDLVTIGPCCNTDYKQGPEKFIEPVAEKITNSSLVVWYVGQMKNNNIKGQEYCWAESFLQNGIYTTKVYPCFCGPMFTPIKY